MINNILTRFLKSWYTEDFNRFPHFKRSLLDISLEIIQSYYKDYVISDKMYILNN